MDETENLFSLAENLSTCSDEDGDISNDDSGIDIAQYYVVSEKSLSLETNYILHMCTSQGVTNRLFVGLSNFGCEVYDLETLSKVATLSGHKSSLSGMKVCCGEDNVVFTSSLDGTIRQWDIRVSEPVVNEYKDNSEGKLKPISSFDISLNKKFIVAGTELYEEDAFMLFWDARTTKLLGGYWESHRDDITQVKFHPTRKDCLASGSTDGLMNVFDVSKSTEDDALLYSMNTNSSVGKLFWYMCSSVDVLSCVTLTEELQLWDTDSITPYSMFCRDAISKAMRRRSANHCYLIDFVPEESCTKFRVLAGSTSKRGECLKMLELREKQLHVMAVFNGNKQIVRSISCLKQNDVFVTGGESGFFTVWNSNTKSPVSSFLKEKTKSHHSNIHRKPY